MKIKDLIIKIRKDNNITQEELANILNISRSSIALYERGLRTPNIETLNMLSSKFRINIKEFYNKENIKKDIRKSKSFALSSVMVLLLASVLEACSVVDINNKYGYNIYDDKLLVRNSKNIFIVKVDDFKKIYSDIHRVYNISILTTIKNNSTYHIRENQIFIKNNLIRLHNNKVYICFNNAYNHYSQENVKIQVSQYITIDYNPFIEELPGYNESLEYYEQTGECKTKIDYYLDLINDI